MGLHSDKYIFDNQYPSIEDIIDLASDLSGLEIVKIKPKLSINVYMEGYHDYAYELAFKDFPQNSVEVYTYINDEDNQLTKKEEQEFSDEYTHFKSFKCVNLQNYLGQEHTLFRLLSQTLEEMGGISVNDNLRKKMVVKYPLTIKQLKTIQIKHTIKSYFRIFITILLMPIMILINLLIIVFRMIVRPFKKSES